MYRYKICDKCGNVEKDVTDSDNINFDLYSITCTDCTRKKFRFDNTNDLLNSIKDYDNTICSLCGVIEARERSFEYSKDIDGYYMKCINSNSLNSDCSQRIISNYEKPTPICLRLYNLRSKIMGLDSYDINSIEQIDSIFIKYYNIRMITSKDMVKVNLTYKKYFN